MRVKAYLADEKDNESQHYARFHNEHYGNQRVSGWVTEDGIVIFTEFAPEYHPHTGEKLELENNEEE